MKKNKYIGSSFESFLEEDGLVEEVNVAAIKAVIAYHLRDFMNKANITQDEMAKKLRTSRSGLQRLLDPENYSVTLLSLNRAALVIGKKVHINLVGIAKPKLK